MNRNYKSIHASTIPISIFLWYVNAWLSPCSVSKKTRKRRMMSMESLLNFFFDSYNSVWDLRGITIIILGV